MSYTKKYREHTIRKIAYVGRYIFVSDALLDQKVFGQIKGRKYKRCGIVAARMTNKIIAPLQYDGTMDSSLFIF